ncbi:MAG: M48 family metallopeptidase [Treponema sp.]|nr:M48 family metallopeptidase [Treponema sp.]
MNFSNIFVIICCAGIFISILIEQFLNAHQFLFRKKYGHDIPEELKEFISQEDIKRMCDYKNEQYKLYVPEFFVTTALSVTLLFSGFYPLLFNFFWNVTQNIYATTLLFSLLGAIPASIVSLPFELYSEFVIEKKFGFSTTTLKLWIIDSIKSFIIGMLISALLLVAMTVVFEHIEMWWAPLATVYVAFSLLFSFLYPRVVAPLFNKFTPLEDGELKSKVSDFMAKTGFNASEIFVMDASKRSKHSNAYFTGFGKTKRVVLYDTLVNQLTVDELGAVLAHELGHFKKKHIMKRFAVVLPLVYVLLFAMSLLIDHAPLYEGFGFSTSSDMFPHMKFIGLFLLGKVFGNFGILTSVVGNYFSRKHEYEADAFAKKLCGNGEDLSNALVKLNKENKSEVRISKLYSAFTYSHPTLLERLDALRKNSAQ